MAAAAAAVGRRGLLLAVVQASGRRLFRSSARHRLADPRRHHAVSATRRSACALAGVLLSLPASWFVWRAAALILKDEDRAALAALLFNLTLMASVEMLAATPDMPSIVTSAGFCLFPGQRAGERRRALVAGRRRRRGPGPAVKILDAVSGRGRAGLAAARPRCAPLAHDALALGRRAAGAADLPPNLLWQSHASLGDLRLPVRPRGGRPSHRCASWANSWRAQFGLATPLIFHPDGGGPCARHAARRATGLLLAMLVWVGAGLFSEACAARPGAGQLALLSLSGAGDPGGRRFRPRKAGGARFRMIAAPVAAVFLLAVYAQALDRPVAAAQGSSGASSGPRISRRSAKCGRHWSRRIGADAVLTTDYETTAWLRFYPARHSR